jgi:hypothetical protein
MNGELAHSWTSGESTLFACSYGSTPRRLGPDHWQAWGIAFYKAVGEQPARAITDSSEVRSIEYSIENDRLILLLRTYDPRSASPVVLFRETLPVSGDDVDLSVELVLDPPASDPSRVEEIFSFLSGPRPSRGKEDFDQIETALFELRNHGLSDPRGMLARLDSLGTPWWRDGAAAEALSQVQQELQLADRARSHRP